MNLFRKTINKILFVIKYFQLSLLWLYYRFDKWHIGNNIYNRPYKLQITKLLNKLKINSIVEVGCGFGEILEHSDARLKVGYDLDDQVIKAARKISKNIIFKKGSLDDIEEDSFDCLLLFNWIHNLSEIELEKSLNKYYSKLNFLVLDQIQKDTKGYLYHHTFDFLNSNFNLIDTIVAEKDVRNILLYKKKD